jgi:hypothetical protein
MSKISIAGASTGTATFTIESPATSTNRTITIPDATTTLVGTDATQTLTNKTVQGGTVQSATAQASTSGTSIDFTGIPSWVKRITVMFNEVSLSGTSSPLIQIGDAGGIETTGYLATSSITASANAIQGITSTSGVPIFLAVATREVTGNVVFTIISGNTWIASGVFSTYDVTATVQTAGVKELSDTLTQVRITTVNGTDTFDAGSINILFE